ncbi:hypothetical protein M011DRAFT_195081 [Sporormia fimetaria CBS 119925]|uniref:Uncharacterized protein n=1 Tax=Sporormia fimetaria CBS 119925 TaxID=1340428 RepID=A0A6A6V141_9PLEO|nr:hypothetical protein M011DRAFT_195081 [Sporormia fimetaria CBS 119925]
MELERAIRPSKASNGPTLGGVRFLPARSGTRTFYTPPAHQPHEGNAHSWHTLWVTSTNPMTHVCVAACTVAGAKSDAYNRQVTLSPIEIAAFTASGTCTAAVHLLQEQKEPGNNASYTVTAGL